MYQVCKKDLHNIKEKFGEKRFGTQRLVHF